MKKRKERAPLKQSPTRLAVERNKWAERVSQMNGLANATFGHLRERQEMAREDQNLYGRLDWLSVAIGELGGIDNAARKLHINRQAIYAWLKKGLVGVKFDSVVRLSELSGVPLHLLARRLGPFDWTEFEKRLEAERRSRKDVSH